jgi:hypothetical protein
MLVTWVCLTGCSWFGWHKKVPADPSEIIVTGAPAASSIFIDGMQNGEIAARNDSPQALEVAAGTHRVEVHVGDRVVYRENIYVGRGEHRVVRVLSGSGG